MFPITRSPCFRSAAISAAVALLAACGAAHTAPQEPAGGSTLIVADVDETAFARFERSLESGEDTQAANVNVNLPVLGLRMRGAGGLEAGETDAPPQQYASDAGGNWYTQVSEAPFGDLVIEGSLLRSSDIIPTEQTLPTIDAPIVTLGGDDSDDEATAQFVLGNVSYSVTMYCRPEYLDACSSETTVREITASLDLFEQGAGQ